MASGHVNRTKRPNTWLHRPACKREEKPCQLGAVHTWHLCDIARAPIDIRFRANRTFRRHRRMTESDPQRLREHFIGFAYWP
jgi:hypothetical protein